MSTSGPIGDAARPCATPFDSDSVSSAGGVPHERDRGNSGQPLRGRQPQPDGGAADLDEAADDRLDGGGVRRGVPGERLLIDAELLLDALHALDEVVLLGGTLVE